MIGTANKVGYQAFGLTIASDFNLPELSHINMGENLTDVVIIQANLSSLWSELADPDRYFVVKENLVMFQVPNVAIYLVKDGGEIFVSPITGAVADQIRLFILGTCMGAILFQRKILPLHGSAIAIDGKAYAIVGDSGAGKSTLASAFLKRGYQLLSDDVIPVTLSAENIPMVTPAYPQQKLWLESLDQFGMESAGLRPIIDRETKFAVPVPTQFATKSIPLVGVFELMKTEDNEIEVGSIQGLERLHILFNHTYRNFFIARLGLLEWHFHTTTKILNHIDLYQLRRPLSRFTAHELADLMLAQLNKGEKVR